MKSIYYKSILLIVTMFVFSYTQAKKHTIILSGEVDKNIKISEIVLWYWEDLIDKRDPGQERTIVRANIIKGRFKIIIHPQNPSVYLNFGWHNNSLGSVDGQHPYLYIGENDDNVHVKIDTTHSGYQLKFFGFGSSKYNCKQELSVQYAKFKPISLLVREPNPISEIKYIENYNNDILSNQSQILEKYKNRLSAFSYNLFKTDVSSNILYYYSRQLSQIYQYNQNKNSTLKILVGDLLTSLLKIKTNLELTVSAKILQKSAFLSLAVVNLAILNSNLSGTSVMSIIDQERESVIRDRILAQYFLRFSKNLYSSEKEALYKKIKELMRDKYSIESINHYNTSTETGTKSYDFALPNVNGKVVRLSDFKGKVVFIDFWFVGCSGCAEYYRNVVKHVESIYRYSDDIVFIAISIDTNLSTWLNGIKSGKFTSENIVNLHCPDGAKNPIIKQFSVNAYPHPLIIDREGNVFSNSTKELRYDGIDGLQKAIEKAINKKDVRTAIELF